jgi:hypothetical protein
MKLWKQMAPLVGLTIYACSGTDQHHSQSVEVGTLSLALTATDNAGELYRLRDAAFYLEGYLDYSFPTSQGGAGGSADTGYYHAEWLTTESTPDASVITRRVVPGTYYVTFDSSRPWYIEHVTASGSERVRQAVLLSSTTQYAYVYQGQTTSVFYEFGVGGTVLAFRHGDISIGIGVEHPEQSGAGGAGATSSPAGGSL